MIRIYIVDDEPMAIQYFKYLLKDSGSTCELCGAETSSTKALFDIQKLKPDIVFTDISMPVMDGLELARKVLENTDAIIYLLTSYEDFDYAKKGVKIGVEDYILKNELSEDMLRGLLDRASEKIVEKKKKQYLILEQNLRAFLESDIDDHDLPGIYNKSLQRYAIGCFFEPCAIYVTPGQDKDRRWHYDCMALRDLSFPKGLTCKGFVKVKRDEYCSIFFIAPDVNDSSRLIYKACDLILQELGKQSAGWKCLQSEPLLHFEDIQKAYREADKYSHYLYSKKESKIFWFKDFGQLKTGLPVNEEGLEKIRSYMEECEHERAVQEVRGFFDYSRDKLGQQEYTESMRSLMRVIRGVIAQKNLNPDNYLISSIYYDPDDLERAILNCVEMYFDELSENRDVAYSEHILKAMDFVRKHYMDEISVPVMASFIGISEGHLRRLFKQELGKNVVDYVTDYRIEKAEIMLKDRNVEYADIWKLTGFSSSQYFNVVFKKKTGKLPRDFMRAARGIR